MNFFTMTDGKRQVQDINPNFEKSFDIIVDGLGASGTYSAISASDCGASVFALERTDSVGGMNTAGQVSGYYYGFDGGLYQKIDKEVQHRTAKFEKIFCHPDVKQAILMNYLNDRNVEISFNSVVAGLFSENSRIIGARILCKGKYTDIKSKFFIDATSDGFAVMLTGVKTFVGRPTDGKTTPYTSRITFEEKDGKVRVANNDSGFVNQYSTRSLSQRIITGHAGSVRVLKKGEKIIAAAAKIGVREGLRFEGENLLDLESVINSKKCEKPLFYAYSDIDKHGHDTAVDTDIFQDWFVLSNLATCTLRIPVPIGCVIPKGISGFACAGRCLSVDSYVSSAVRMNRDMFRLGECLGVLCAMAAKQNVGLLEADYEKYVNEVEKRGCFYGDKNKNLGFSFPGEQEKYTPVNWLTDEKQITEALKTITPGVAIWSCRLLGEKVRPALRSEIAKTSDNYYRDNLAIALAITGDEFSLPYLRDAVKRRSCLFYLDCRRTNQFPSVNAICCLGRFCDLESYDMLCSIAFDEKEYYNEIYHTLKPQYIYFSGENFNYVYFQYLTHSIMALVKIVHAHKELCEDLRSRLCKLFSNDDYIKRITPLESYTKEYGEVRDFADYVMKIL